MYISRNAIKNAANALIDDHGTIRRIYKKENNCPIGYIIRKEVSVGADTAEVLFNISFNGLYGDRYFTPSEYKFFAIQHTNKVIDFEKDVDAEIELTPRDEKYLASYIMQYLSDVESRCPEGHLGNDLVFLEVRIRDEIMKSVNYYKGRNVRAYFTINF